MSFLAPQSTCCQEENVILLLRRSRCSNLASRSFSPVYSAQLSSSQSANGITLQQVNRYLEMDDDDDDCQAFWRCNRVNLNKLIYPAIQALSVP